MGLLTKIREHFHKSMDDYSRFEATVISHLEPMHGKTPKEITYEIQNGITGEYDRDSIDKHLSRHKKPHLGDVYGCLSNLEAAGIAKARFRINNGKIREREYFLETKTRNRVYETSSEKSLDALPHLKPI